MRRFDRICVSCAAILTLLVSCALPNSKNPEQPVEGEFSFAGTAWVLGSLGSKPVLKDTTVTLEFDNESFRGSSGCNDYGGTYAVTDAAVSFTDVGSTARACTAPAGVMQQEARYEQALYRTVTYRVTASRLELLDNTDTVTMTFTQGGETP